MSEEPEVTQPEVIFAVPNKKEEPVRKVRGESEDEREMNDALFLETIADEINDLRAVEDGVFGHLPSIRAWRDKACQLGLRMIEDDHLRQVRQFANKHAKVKGLSDPDELQSRAVFELAVRMGRFYMSQQDQRREAQAGTGYRVPRITKKEVQEWFFGTNPKKMEVYNPKGSEYAVSSIVKQQASHVRKVLNSPDSGKMVLLGELHESVGTPQNADDKRRARMERESGASLDNPERYTVDRDENGQVVGEGWVPVEGHDPANKDQSHVRAWMANDSRDALKGWHMQGGAQGGSVVQSMHDVTMMRPADIKYYETVWTDSVRRALQATVRLMVKNGYARRQVAKSNPDQAESLYSERYAQEEEIMLRLVEGLKQAIERNEELPDNVVDYLLARYMSEELRDRNSRYTAQPGSAFPKPGTRIEPGTILPQRSIPQWNEESGKYDWIPDGVERTSLGYRFGAGWDIGRMGDVTHRRRINYQTMAKEVNVKEGDLKRALPQVAKRAIKLANLHIDNMAAKQTERNNRLEDYLNTFEPVEGMRLVYRVPNRVMSTRELLELPRWQQWGRHGTDVAQGFTPGEMELPYEERTSITIRKEWKGQTVEVQRVHILLDPTLFRMATDDNEPCPTCDEHPLPTKPYSNGQVATECASCRKVDQFVPSHPASYYKALWKEWEG